MFAQKIQSIWIGIDLPSSKYFYIQCDTSLLPFDEIIAISQIDTVKDLDFIAKKYNFLTCGGNIKVQINNCKNKLFGIIDYTNKTVYGKSGQKFLTIFRPLSFPSSESYLITTKNKLSNNVYAYATLTDEKHNGFNILQCTETLGNVNQQIFDIFAPFHSYDVFPKKWKKTIASVTSNVLDLTDKNVFSIDGESTVDVDDAIHLESNEQHHIIGIHIADVANMYLTGISELEKKNFLEHILQNCSSIYPQGKVDMINKDVGEKICSLVEGEERNVVSLLLQFEVIPPFTLQSARIHLSKIVNKHKLTYKLVDTVLTSKKKHPLRSDFYTIQQIIDANPCLPHQVENMDYDSNELISRNMVAKLMATYNTFMAKKLFDKNANSILRIHHGNTGKSEQSGNEEIQQILDRMETYKGYYVVSSQCKLEDVKHEGLGLTYYTHMTSPIRRFVDFWNQICLYEMLGHCSRETSRIDIRSCISTINWKQMQIKKAYEQLATVQLFHQKLNGELDDQYEAYILGLEENSVNVYVPKLNQKIVRLQVSMDNLDNILEIVEQNENSTIWRKKDNGLMFKLEKFMKIQCRIITKKNKYNWNHKIGVELLQPNFSDFLLQ